MHSRWTFERSVDADFDALMSWFTSGTDVRRWGGPEFEYPYSPASFRRDCRWPEIAAFSLRDSDGELRGFGQFYERDGHINLARIAVQPESRGQGIARELVPRLMAAGLERLNLPSFSLYVYRDNEAALRCYRSLGFKIRPYPPGQELANACFYMTRPAGIGAGPIDNKVTRRGEEK